ncbi:Amino acid ABC transporter substrate-binding protein OS=Stutzerimonas stutzeri OX=316 GN=CXK95_12930 PE=4 SV=1 [Stutzerimonas stutzeri]
MGFGLLLRSVLVALLVVPSLAFAVGKCERLVATGAADNPPFLWRDPQNPQRLLGANAELLKQIGKSLGVKVELLYSGDASKALDEVRSGRVDILADARLVTQRLDKMDFVHPSIASLQTVAWVRNEPGSSMPRATTSPGMTDVSSAPVDLVASSMLLPGNA